MGHHDKDHKDHHGHKDHGHGDRELSFKEKGARLLEHWIHHNNDHLGGYRRWASEFRTHHFSEIAELLESVADLTGQINDTLEDAARLLSGHEHTPKEG
jgi:hypothetical protein